MQTFDGQPVIDWETEYEDVDIDEVLAGKSTHVTKQQQAGLFIRKWLAEGAVASTEIRALAEEAGISFATFKAAKHEIGVMAKKRDGIWWWELPPRE
jgi:hypothetical protein